MGLIDNNSDSGDSQQLADARADMAGMTTSADPYMMFEFMRLVDMESYADDLAGIDKKISDINEALAIDPIPSPSNNKAAIVDLEKSKKIIMEKASKRNISATVAMYWTPGFQVNDSMNYDQDSRKLMAMWDEIKDRVDIGGMLMLEPKALEDAGSIIEQFKGDDAIVAKNHFQAEIATAFGSVAGFLTGGAAGGMVGGSGGGISAMIGTEELRKMGKVVNPNEYMNYKSTNLRSFQFNWKFLPDSQQESEDCIDIIGTFRAAAHAHKKSPFVLAVPDHLVISFHGVDGIPALPPVIITSVAVTYNPNAASFFSQNNNPVEIDLAVTCQEMMPIYRDDVEFKGY